MITKLMIIICVAIYVIINFYDKQGDKISRAIKYGALYPPKVTNNKEYWRFITANFVHVDFIHIFMNMYCIYFLGDMFEEFLQPLPYIFLVLVAALTTSLVTYVVAVRNPRLENVVTLGASGIFYGYLGAMIALGIILQGAYMDFLIANSAMIGINVVFTLSNKRVSKTGHFGGLVGGFIAMAILIGIGACAY